ncbi:Oidioi.mRNA.OKI2018_I69.XSR.g13907.t1.cds [Oikopleura dioica]|uniref:Oidioi.mRNA.OKI2018_I69.XSR.g13907.t1.cds n=1 Tax=Oikopleura dioica TaxID=34765 RepID=A0ABN7SEH3_OIKDI|nr:Oidioi.mRNA.OKI2018_I69.XSR.g13907.t1.cds [Oikopleura dioica]
MANFESVCKALENVKSLYEQEIKRVKDEHEEEIKKLEDAHQNEKWTLNASIEGLRRGMEDNWSAWKISESAYKRCLDEKIEVERKLKVSEAQRIESGKKLEGLGKTTEELRSQVEDLKQKQRMSESDKEVEKAMEALMKAYEAKKAAEDKEEGGQVEAGPERKKRRTR